MYKDFPQNAMLSTNYPPYFEKYFLKLKGEGIWQKNYPSYFQVGGVSCSTGTLRNLSFRVSFSLINVNVTPKPLTARPLTNQ